MTMKTQWIVRPVHIKMALRATLLRCLAVAPILMAPGFAASLVIDTFDDGPFSLSHDRSASLLHTQSGGMLGDLRRVWISTDRRQTIVTADLVTGTSVLSFDTGDGPALGSGLGQGSIQIRWNSSPALNLLGSDAFLLSVSNLQGTGRVHVGVNESGGFGSSSSWVPLTAAGDLLIPFEQVDIQGTLGNVVSMQLIIVGASPDFAVAIDTFQIVPEPSIATMAGFGVFLLATRRRRNGSHSP